MLSLAGIFAFILFAWMLSSNHKIINWRVVFWGLVLPILFAFFIFKVPAGRDLFLTINDGVLQVLASAKKGMLFVFGPLALSPGETDPSAGSSIGFILAFQALPTIIFFSALLSLLYYTGLMSLLVRGFSRVFTKLMRISGAESLYVSSNIFVGVESAFTVRPYLARMTNSELCTILTMGMGSVASSVLAFYTFLLKGQFPAIAGHLVSASIMAAPVSILISKLMMPETDQPETLGLTVKDEYKKPASWIEAVIQGANEGVRLCVGIVALLLAFWGLLELVNWLLVITIHQSLQNILGYVFYPFAYLMGVPGEDVSAVAQLLGERSILTEATSYQHLAEYIKSGVITNPRSMVITTYALCGFAHIASVAIFVGGTTSLVPERAKDIARIGFKALIAATITCMVIGAIAGLFFSGSGTILLGK
jgi:CNT family concentrative nucleoside transporter